MPFFVEIGTANFDTLLKLAEAGWTGIVVEPIPHLADDLRRMFSDHDVQIVQAAISDYDGRIDMAVARGDGWQVGISHCVSDTHLGWRASDQEANRPIFTETISVQCMTLDRLLLEVGEVDLMKVDVEGHEINVFMNYSFRVRPRLIKVEHKHVDASILRRKLETNGYLVWTEKDDIYAVA